MCLEQLHGPHTQLEQQPVGGEYLEQHGKKGDDVPLGQLRQPVDPMEILKQLGFLWGLLWVGAGHTRSWFSEVETAGGLQLLLCPWFFRLVSCTLEDSMMIGCTEEEYEDSLVDQV